MQFVHAPTIWQAFPELVAGAIHADGIHHQAHVAGSLQVRHATGDEDYLAFSGEHERPDVGEVIFADEQGRVHARRWCNRQSALSAIRPATAKVLIVAEAMHDAAVRGVPELLGALERELTALWSARVRAAVLTREAPGFELAG